MDLSYWPEPFPGGAKHLSIMHDQLSALLACVPLVKKRDAVESIQQFIPTCEKYFGVRIAVVHSDQGGKLKNARI